MSFINNLPYPGPCSDTILVPDAELPDISSITCEVIFRDSCCYGTHSEDQFWKDVVNTFSASITRYDTALDEEQPPNTFGFTKDGCCPQCPFRFKMPDYWRICQPVIDCNDVIIPCPESGNSLIFYRPELYKQPFYWMPPFDPPDGKCRIFISAGYAEFVGNFYPLEGGSFTQVYDFDGAIVGPCGDPPNYRPRGSITTTVTLA